MKMTIDHKQIRNVAVFMTLLYAFTTRSILAKFLFQNQIELLAFYGVTYVCLIVSVIGAFFYDGVHLYAPKGFFSILTLFLVIFYGLILAHNNYSLLYYGLALLMPFAVFNEIKNTTFYARLFAVMALFFTVGCVVNFIVPSTFKAIFYPLYSASAQQSLLEVERISETSTYFAGFTSQVGYTSFFISLGVGAVFCFKDTIYKKSWPFLMAIMFSGLLLTGKRGPIVFLLVALLSIYFFSGYGKDQIIRFVKIIGIIVAAVILLGVIANVTKIDGIIRIYNAVYEFLTAGSVDDAGRNQLHEQALRFFEENPIFGIGWTNFRVMYSFRSTHVHCIYLQLLCETGLVGFGIFVTFFATRLINTLSLVRKTRLTGNMQEGGWIKFYFFIQLYFLLYGITGNPLYDIEETIMYFFAIGISYLPLLSSDNNIAGEE